MGPRKGEGDEEIKLRNATMNCLLLAEEYHIESIAFPAISTGIFGFPVETCAEIMLKVSTEFIKRSEKIKHIILVLWDKHSFTIFLNEMEKLVSKLTR